MKVCVPPFGASSHSKSSSPSFSSRLDFGLHADLKIRRYPLNTITHKCISKGKGRVTSQIRSTRKEIQDVIYFTCLLAWLKVALCLLSLGDMKSLSSKLLKQTRMKYEGRWRFRYLRTTIKNSLHGKITIAKNSRMFTGRQLH